MHIVMFPNDGKEVRISRLAQSDIFFCNKKMQSKATFPSLSYSSVTHIVKHLKKLFCFTNKTVLIEMSIQIQIQPQKVQLEDKCPPELSFHSSVPDRMKNVTPQSVAAQTTQLIAFNLRFLLLCILCFPFVSPISCCVFCIAMFHILCQTRRKMMRLSLMLHGYVP